MKIDLYKLTSKYGIRDSKPMRVIVKPFKDIQFECRYRQYLRSEDSREMRKLKDTHKGERCFVIGNGPSLKAEDLERLKGKFTFASNRIYEIFPQTEWRPTVYVVSDYNFLRDEYEKPCGVQSKLKLISFAPHVHKEDFGDNTIQIFGGFRRFVVNCGTDTSAYIPEDISKGFSNGYTVTFIAIQAAIYMGFKEIYLLGVDFDYPNVLGSDGKIKKVHGGATYFNEKADTSSRLIYAPVLNAYQVAKKYCDEHGIKIKNATRGGKLEVFERVDFDELMGQKEAGE